MTGLVVAMLVLPVAALVATGLAFPANLADSDLTTRTAAITLTVVFWVWTGVAIAWMAVARRNAEAIHPGGTWRTGWAVGAWFVPLAYLALGFFVMRDIWHGTMHRDRPWSSVRAPAWVLGGWLLWAVPKAVGHMLLFSRGSFMPVGLPGYPVWTASSAGWAWSQALWIALDAAAAVLFLRFIYAIARAQDAPMPGLPGRARATASDP